MPFATALKALLCLPLAAFAPADVQAQAQAPSEAGGDAARGRALLLQRHDTGCILCHVVPGLPQGGAIGPALGRVGSRLTAAELRARIADARRFNADTIMPPYLSTTGLQNVGRAHAGKTVLSEQALDDIVAYLLSTEGDAKVQP
jgi:sulfur-oxidizing protein SoxX